MKRMLAGVALALVAATLSGCYYDPGYSYVRSNGYAGDAYYGDRGTVVYDDGYYAPGYSGSGYYGGYGYAPGVSVGISSNWYGDSRYRGRDRHWDRDDHHGGGHQEWGRGNGGRGEGGRADGDRGNGQHRGNDGGGDHRSGHGRRDDHDDDQRH